MRLLLLLLLHAILPLEKEAKEQEEREKEREKFKKTDSRERSLRELSVCLDSFSLFCSSFLLLLRSIDNQAFNQLINQRLSA